MSFLLVLFFFIIFQLFIVYPWGKMAFNFLGIKLWWGAELIFGLIIGIVLQTLVIFGLGYTNNYNLLPAILIIFPILLFFQYRKISLRRINPKEFFKKENLLVIVAIILCVLIQSAIVFKNGETLAGQVRLQGVFLEDATWHIGIINNLQKSIPPNNPLFAGEKIVNYHYFTDIFIAAVYKFTNIEILTLYFKLIGPFLAFLFATSLYFLLKEITGNKLISALGILLIILSSTYYYLFAFLKPDLNISPGSFFGNDYEARMVNYQLLFSYLIVTTFAYLTLIYKKTRSLRFAIFAAIFIGGGFGFKSYGTILLVAGLLGLCILKSFKKDFSYFKIVVLSVFFTFFIIQLLQNSKAQESVFIFKPFWMIENMFSDPIRLHVSAWEAQRNLSIENKNYLRLGYLYLKGLIIFLFANLGLRLLGLLTLFRFAKEIKKDVILLLSIISLLGIILPILFVQGGVSWNTIQFFFYSSVCLGILLVLFLAQLTQRLGLKLVVVLLLVIGLSFSPGVYLYSKYYLSDKDNLTRYNYQGTQEAYQAAKFLSFEKDGILLLDSQYLQTPFIPAISKKDAYFADITVMSNQLVNWQMRNEKVEKFFDRLTTDDYRQNFLEENNISYIFTAKDGLGSESSLNEIYKNNEVSIYKVN